MPTVPLIEIIGLNQGGTLLEEIDEAEQPRSGFRVKEGSSPGVVVGQGQGQLRNMGPPCTLPMPTFLDMVPGSIKA